MHWERQSKWLSIELLRKRHLNKDHSKLSDRITQSKELRKKISLLKRMMESIIEIGLVLKSIKSIQVNLGTIWFWYLSSFSIPQPVLPNALLFLSLAVQILFRIHESYYWYLNEILCFTFFLVYIWLRSGSFTSSYQQWICE